MATPGFSRWVLIGLAVIAAALVAVVAVGAPLWLAPSGRFTTASEAVTVQNQVRTTLLQGLGGGALLVGVYLTWRQLQHTIHASQQQRELDRQGQLTQRFSTAIDQLGNGELAVRLGGIYTLARIARRSPEDRTAVVEVLAAYVRERAPWPPSRPEQLPAGTALSDQVGDASPPEVPIRGWLNFEQASLAGAQLESAVLRGARLAGATLWRACLAKAYLPGADLRAASLIGADLHGADLRGACLAEAELQEANLIGTDLRGADLRGASVDAAQLHSAITDNQTIPPGPTRA